jgi:predicted Zn-dependent peptidase
MTSGDDAQEASAPAAPAVRRTGRRAVLAAGGALAGSHLLPQGVDRAFASATQQPPLSGLLVAPGATAEGGAEGTPGSLVVELTLTNAGPSDLSGIELRLPLPAGARVESSWQGGRDRNPGAVSGSGSGGSVRWGGIAIKAGERLAPFSARLVPAEGASGAVLFRAGAVQPEVSGAPQAVLPRLALNGLWGDDGLRRTVLPSGLTVLTRERPDTASVALRLAVRAGSRDEDDTTSGGSHWLEHAYFLGTTSRPSAQAIDNAVSAVGGVTNASTSFEYTDYWKLVPAEHFSLALEVLADQLLNSTFLPDAFERERRVVFEELKQRNDAAGTRAFDEFVRLVFRVSPLRRDAGGTIESVQAIPIPVILAHRDRLYRTGNMAIAAIGPLHHVDAVEQIEKALEGLPRGPRQERPEVPEPVQREMRRLDLGDGTGLAEVRFGWPAPGDSSPDSAPMSILEEILGATGRRLTEEIRDRRALATSIGPSYVAFHDAGVLMIGASTQPQNVDDVVRLALDEVRRLRDGAVTVEDVAASLRALAGRRALSSELNQNQATRAVLEVSGTMDSFEEYLARVAPVTPADVQRVARTYLDPDAFTLVQVRQ